MAHKLPVPNANQAASTKVTRTTVARNLGNPATPATQASQPVVPRISLRSAYRQSMITPGGKIRHTRTTKS